MIKVGFWKRAAAIIIDLLLLDLVTKLSLYPLEKNIDFESFLTGDFLVGFDSQQLKGFLVYLLIYSLASLILSLCYFTYFHGSTGQTPGKMLLRIKIVKVSGEPLDFYTALIRWNGYFISASVMALGFLWVIFDKNKQGWHDKLAGTYVVKAETLSDNQPEDDAEHHKMHSHAEHGIE